MQGASLIGKTVDKYRLVSLLGEGGMGAVYVAEHQTIGRQAALKVLRPELAVQPDSVQRFLNEARATNRIKHRGIVDIYDCGQSPEVGTYLVMELLQGQSLDRYCQRGSCLPAEAVVDLVTQVADALEAAHRAKIVHRDLKPANIFVVHDGDEPAKKRVKVLDFGIAKLLGGAGPHTRTGSLLGTPAYMSPEQCHGAHEVDHRTDIYALGTIAYELLCGRPPFVAEGYGQLISMHLGAPPPSLRQLAPAVPEALEHVVLQTLAKSADERYQSMAALANALRQAVPAPQPPILGTEPTIAAVAASHGAESIPPTLSAAAAPPGADSIPPIRVAQGESPEIPPTVQAPFVASAPPAAGPVSLPASTTRSRLPIILAASVLLLVIAGTVSFLLFVREPSSAHSTAKAGSAATGLASAKLADATAQRGSRSPTVHGAEQHALPPPGTATTQQIPPAGPCPRATWQAATTAVDLVREATRRSPKMIVGFNLDDVIQGPSQAGRGGLAPPLLRGCTDSPAGRFAAPGAATIDQHSGLRVEIVAVQPAGRTGRSWPGVKCTYRISDPDDPRQHATIGGAAVPPHNELITLVRQGAQVFATLQFNGYAKEVGGKGNRVLGIDLCEHRVVWRSPDMVSNGQVLAYGEHLITSYGFTAEPDWLYAIDGGTGAVRAKARLPKAADKLRLAGDRLYVRIYDGYMIFRLSSSPRK